MARAVPTCRTRRTCTPGCWSSGAAFRSTWSRTSRYIDVKESADGAATQFDLSGGTALAQKIWEEVDGDTLADRGVIVAGDPESCINAVKLHEATGVDQVQFLMATETIGHANVMKSIELFGKHVIPAFK